MTDRRPERFTPEEQERIRAHVRVRGMTFEAFLPEGLANWLRKRMAAGDYADPGEAAFVAFQELRALDRHPQVRDALLQAQIESALADPNSGIPADALRTKIDGQFRKLAATKPPPADRRWRTGRSQQVNIKATPEVIERFHRLADAQGVPHGVLLERALDALERAGWGTRGPHRGGGESGGGGCGSKMDGNAGTRRIARNEEPRTHA